MKTKLTDAKLKSIKAPTSGRLEISDTERVGLRFRMTSKGAASWLYQKQIKGGPRRGFRLGSYPGVSLAQARAAALEIQIEAERGYDRVLENDRAAAKSKAEALVAKTVKDILDLYIANHIEQELKAGQSREERKRQLRTYLQPHYEKRLDQLSRSDLQTVVDAKQAEGKIVMANRLRAALSAFTHWAYRRGYVEVDIGAALQRAGKEVARQRTPTLDEVHEIWNATYQTGDLWGPFFRLCILTGQRSRSDVLAMRWSWIDFEKRRYEIPNPKNGQPHIVHLSEPAFQELQMILDRQQKTNVISLPSQGAQKRMTDTYVFTTTGKTQASGVTKAKSRLDAAIAANRKKNGNTVPLEAWVLHDLRRSQATALAEAGYDEGVVDRIQNHVAGGSRASAVAAVYNKAHKLPQRAEALEAWARMVANCGKNPLQVIFS